MELLKVENLTFTYPKQNPDAAEPEPTLQNVSFQVQEGAFVVVCGESGCGKTTLLKLLKRELAPAGERSGNIWFHGVEQAALTEREAACEIGFVLQNPENQTVTDKVWHELAFGLESLGLPTEAIRKRVAEMCSFFGLNSIFHKKVNELSGGQKRRVAIAGVMAMHPRVLVLDEPAAGLDPEGRDTILSQIKAYHEKTGITVLLVSHSMEDIAKYANRVLVMHRAKIAMYDTVEKVFAHAQQLLELGLSVPQVTQIFLKLRQMGLDIPADVYTIPYAVKTIRRALAAKQAGEVQ